MVRIMLGLLVIVMLISLAGCDEVVGVARSEKTRDLAPDVSNSDLELLVDGNSQFAFDLYREISSGEGNLFYSPFSISQALAMTYAGARGETESQMADTLHLLLPQERLHQAFNALDLALASRGEGAAGKDGEGFRLNIVNATWGQEDFLFLEEYLDILAVSYAAGITFVDFIEEPEASRIRINNWVSEQTEGRIEDLIPEGAIDSLTRLVLTNAIYFNAAWLCPFDEDNTADGVFHLVDGGQVSVPMMAQTESFGYMKGQGFQAVELPYDGRELSMVILLPDDGQYSEIENSLNAGLWAGVVEGLEYQQVTLSMPKFEFEAELDLADTLAAMGMPEAFSEAADFSGMTGKRDLAISDVLHKAFVAVDEAGTEAAAATAVIMKLTAVPGEPVRFSADRPFMFFIRDIETNAILFAGRVMNPAL